MPDEGHRIIIRQTVPDSRKPEYERWLALLHEELRAQPGFDAVEVIHRAEGGATRYLVVAAFTGEEARDAWLASERLAALRSTLDDIAGASREVHQLAGREIWFEEPGLAGPAPYWKRVTMRVICVLPMLWLVQSVVGVIGGPLPRLARPVLAVVILSCLLTWPVMPLAVRFAEPWLSRRSSA